MTTSAARAAAMLGDSVQSRTTASGRRVARGARVCGSIAHRHFGAVSCFRDRSVSREDASRGNTHPARRAFAGRPVSGKTSKQAAFRQLEDRASDDRSERASRVKVVSSARAEIGVLALFRCFLRSPGVARRPSRVSPISPRRDCRNAASLDAKNQPRAVVEALAIRLQQSTARPHEQI